MERSSKPRTGNLASTILQDFWNDRARLGARVRFKCERKSAKSAKKDAKKKQKSVHILSSSRPPSRSSRFRVRMSERRFTLKRSIRKHLHR